MSFFVDEATVQVTGGSGGHGLIAFRREKHVPRGGPCGGDGGRGGDVIIEVDTNLHTLLDFRYKKHFKADRGQHGGGSGKTGRSGDHTIIQVPPGTEITDADTSEPIGDLTETTDRVVVVRGGRGGRGNARFATPTLRAPQEAEDGVEGQSRRIRLTLKLMADVGLVGFPNAGKSTLLASVSQARPKVADYPFTTLEPHLGIVSAGEFRSFVMADIPGLIEGANQGKGLGHQFLRHIERTRILLFLIDCTDPAPEQALATLRAELEGHSPELARKPYRVALTKTDLLPPGEDPPGLSRFTEKPFMISAHSRNGLAVLLARLYEWVEKRPSPPTQTGRNAGLAVDPPES